MGLWDFIENAAEMAAKAITNPIHTAKTVLEAPVRLIHAIGLAANTMDEMPSALRELLQSPIGVMEIEELVVFREEVNSAVRLSAHLITAGKLTMDIRHVFEVFVLVDRFKSQAGETKRRYVRIEKNEIVECKEISLDELQVLKKDHHNGYMTIRSEVLSKLTLKQFFDNYAAKTDAKKLWVYDPATANCQVFVYLGLMTNGIKVTQEMEDFIVQKEVKRQIGAISGAIMKGVTTMANFAHHLVGAEGSVFEALQRGEAQQVPDDDDIVRRWIREADNQALWWLLNRHAALKDRWRYAVMDVYRGQPKRMMMEKKLARKRGREEDEETSLQTAHETLSRRDEDALSYAAPSELSRRISPDRSVALEDQSRMSEDPLESEMAPEYPEEISVGEQSDDEPGEMVEEEFREE